MDKYTKVSDKMLEDKRFNLADCVIYAKLTYRMKLSIKSDKFFNNGHYVIYKINDLSHDCGVSRNVVINSLKKLSKLGYVAKDRKLFGLRLYLPKFKMARSQSRNKSYESHKAKLTSNNQDQKINNNNHVSVDVDMKRAKNYPNVTEIIKTYGRALFDYGIKIYHHEMKLRPIHNAYNFVVGILRCWRSKGINNVSSAAIYEGRPNDIPNDPNGPKIPIFKI